MGLHRRGHHPSAARGQPFGPPGAQQRLQRPADRLDGRRRAGQLLFPRLDGGDQSAERRLVGGPTELRWTYKLPRAKLQSHQPAMQHGVPHPGPESVLDPIFKVFFLFL